MEPKFSNWSCFVFLKSAQLPITFNPVGLAMPIPGLLGKNIIKNFSGKRPLDRNLPWFKQVWLIRLDATEYR